TLFEWPHFPNRKVSFKAKILPLLAGIFNPISSLLWSDPILLCTLREKLGHLSKDQPVRAWSSQLSQEWMESDPELAGLLYVDGHVRVYHGRQTPLPKRYVARQRLCLRGTTDYWVNDREGRPFFVVPAAVSPGIIEMMRSEIVPRLLEEVPHQPSTAELEADLDRHRWVVIF